MALYTFESQPHVFRAEAGQQLAFPGHAHVEFRLNPPEPLGSSERVDRGRSLARPCRTMVDSGEACEMTANTFNGRVSAVNLPMGEVGVRRRVLDVQVELKGNRLHVEFEADTMASLDSMVQTFYYGLPPLLSLEMIDPFTVTWVGGQLGGVRFAWEVEASQPAFDSTNPDKQAARVVTALDRLEFSLSLNSLRLAAALDYSHRAMLLSLSGDAPWDFVGEALLNWNKVLEALFTTNEVGPQGQPQTHKQVREALVNLGYRDEDIEHFIAVMKLRDEFDVGHVNIWPHKPEHLTAVNDFVIHLEPLFRSLLNRLFDRLQAQTFSLPADDSLPPWSSTTKTLDFITTRLGDAPFDQTRLRIEHAAPTKKDLLGEVPG